MGLLNSLPGQRRLLTLFVALATTAFALAPVAADEARRERALELTCKARMQTLAEQEAERLAQIEWHVVSDGVRGTYVGYAPDFTCRMGEPGQEPPTARLRYQEVVWAKSGTTARQAMAATPKPVEIREVTVVLVYRDGIWR